MLHFKYVEPIHLYLIMHNFYYSDYQYRWLSGYMQMCRLVTEYSNKIFMINAAVFYMNRLALIFDLF